MQKSQHLWKPILSPSRYPFGMTSARLPLAFSLDPDSTFDTLEMVLAIARRIGLHLARLEFDAGRVCIDLHAGDDDPLALFRARLDNVIGVHDVCMLPNE